MKHIADLYLRLRADNAGEFRSKALSTWCTTRTILHTFTPGDQAQSNGRAEATIGHAKSCIRRMLLAAKADFKRWPIAARCLNEQREANGTVEDVPPFLSPVLTRKRFWRSRELEPTQENVLYLAPSWLRHGHWVERPDGTQYVARMVMRKFEDPPTEEQWVGVEDHLNALELRRRVRGKITVRQLRKVEAEESEIEDIEGVSTEEEEQEKEQRFTRLIEEEMTHAVCEEQAALDVVLEAVAKLRQAAIKPNEAEEVLQTRIVSQQEVRKKAKESYFNVQHMPKPLPIQVLHWRLPLVTQAAGEHEDHKKEEENQEVKALRVVSATSSADIKRALTAVLLIAQAAMSKAQGEDETGYYDLGSLDVIVIWVVIPLIVALIAILAMHRMNLAELKAKSKEIED
eukprot:s2430_g3.t1